MKTTVIVVQGMSCQGCVTNITQVLQGLAGVSRVEVSLEPAEARVDYDGAQIDRAALCAAIEDAGFDAR